MKRLWLSSAFRRTAMALFATLLLGIFVVGQVVLPALAQSTNLAQGKPVTCSSTENSSFPCVNAVDGNTGTRWSSAFSDPQWIQVDLGDNYNINRVVLLWEAAYGWWYEIQVSADSNNWSTIYSTTTGNGGTDDLTVSGFGRYVRMVGRARSTQWGYSLWEFQVYGSSGPTLPDLVVTSLFVRFDPNVTCYTSEIPIAKPILGIDVAFMNAGNANAGPFVVTYRNTSTGASSQQSLSGLAAGQRSTVFFPDTTISYRHGVEVTVDSLNQVAEANESNNTSSIQVPPEGTPLPRCTPTPTPTITPTTQSPVLPHPLSVSPLPAHTCEQQINLTGTTGHYSNVTAWVYDLNSGQSQRYFQFTSGSVLSIPVALYPETQNGLVVQSCNDYVPVVCSTLSYTQRPDLIVDTTGCGGTSTPTATPTPPPPVNRALNRPVVASSTENSSFGATNAVDGRTGTRWSSRFSDPQWIQVDLGATVNINRVVLRWETAYGRAYQIQVSDDASAWVTIYTTGSGNGGLDDLNGLSGSGRYVRMVGTMRATQWGYSLWEFEVYGEAGGST